MTKNLIIIPARYGSTRLPAKPLAMIAGQTMLARMVAIARTAMMHLPDTELLVATDHAAIMQHCEEVGAPAILTPADCPSGTDRCAAALQAAHSNAEFIINLQGDTPLTPPDFIVRMCEAYHAAPADVVTLVTQLNWDALDDLRTQKQSTPFSGTTVTMHPHTHDALWFSKQILPAIRNEATLRAQQPLSPVWRHIGMYGYSREMLLRYPTLSEGHYEQLEGLEQLRLLEHGYQIRCVAVEYGDHPAMNGIDSPEDILRAEALLSKL
jgi:3-deoxy-manno-octulosonate cytidylyltransferase (CMP-KDO synthetase)